MNTMRHNILQKTIKIVDGIKCANQMLLKQGEYPHEPQVTTGTLNAQEVQEILANQCVIQKDFNSYRCYEDGIKQEARN